MFDKALALSASAGAGHVRAAEAIERGIVEMGAAREARHPAQVIALCGRNEELQDKLVQRFVSSSEQRVSVKVVGHTHEMDEYMAASDILLYGSHTKQWMFCQCHRVGILVRAAYRQAGRVDHF